MPDTTPDTPIVPPMPVTSRAHYVWAVTILCLIGAMLVLAILYMRPASDPLEILGRVMSGLLPTIAAVMAFIKSQETHLSVNSRLDAFIRQHEKMAFGEGVQKGTEDTRASMNAALAVVPPEPENLKDGR